MNELVTIHNGHTIRYAENEDVWRCYDLSLDAPTLTALKAKINKHDADLRRTDHIPVIVVRSYSNERNEGVITLWASATEAWVSSITRQSGKSRTKVRLSDIVLDTPQNRAVLSQIDRLHSDAKKLEAEARTLRDGLERVQPPAGIVEASP